MYAAQMVRCQGMALCRGRISHATHGVLLKALLGNIADLLQLAHHATCNCTALLPTLRPLE